MVASVG